MLETEEPRTTRETGHHHHPEPAPAALTLWPDQIAEQARRRPSAPAVVEQSGTTDYRTLDARADALAAHLWPLVDAPEAPVAVCLPRGGDVAVAVLAVMRAGGSAVLLNPADPPSRIAAQLTDSGIRAVLTNTLIAATLPDSGAPIVAVDNDANASGERRSPRWPMAPEGLAYAVYTSGSTGKPKAVGGLHGTVANLVTWATSAYRIGPDDRSTWVGPPSFGAVPAEVWAFLAAGAQVHVPPDDVVASPPALRDWMVEHRITVSYLVRTIADRLCDLPWPATTDLRLMISTGERFLRWTPPELPFDFAMTYGSSEMLNITGAVDLGRGLHLTSRDLSPGERAERAPSTGWPMTGRSVLLLDEDLNEVPDGSVGEIYIGGRHLFRGYLGRAGLSADRLVPHPSGAPGERLFRSGDLGIRCADGTLEVIGRIDDQVKIRGHRVEPGELETVLRQHPRINEAVAKAVPSTAGDLRLVAWIAGEHGALPGQSEVRAWLAERLPAALVPSAVVALPAMPQNANGKVDRQALPAPELSRADLGVEYVGPRDPVEAAVAGVCEQILGVPRIGVLDRLPDLGADSLALMRLDTTLEQTFGVVIGVRRLTSDPTPAGIATAITAARTTARATAAGLPDTITSDPEARHEPFRLTDTQQAYWIGRSESVELGGVGCHGYFEWDRDGLEPERLITAWRTLIERHDMLRAVVLPDGRQQVMPEAPAYQVAVADLRGQPAQQVEKHLAEVRSAMENEVFDPQVWPMFQLRLTLLDGERTRVHLSFDLVIADAWSYFSILVPELHELYERPDEVPAPPRITFRDYLVAEQRMTDTPRSRQAEQYWRERLADLPPAPHLPMAVPQPGPGSTPQFRRWTAGLPADSWRRLRDHAAAVGVTPAGVLIAVFAQVLRRWTGQDRFTLNVPLFNRLPLHPDVDRIVGDFTSTSLLAVEDWPGSFAEWATSMQQRLNDDLDHRFFTGTSVLRELNRTRGAAGATMPIVVTPLLGTPRAPATAFGEPVYGASQTPQVLLDYQIYETGQELQFTWDARADLIADGVLDDMFEAHQRLLEALAAPDGSAWQDAEIDLVPAAQLSRRARVNDTGANLPGRLLPDYVAEHAAATPAAPAVVDSRRTIDYAELNRHAELLAEELIDSGVSPGELVAIVLTKGWEQAVAVLATLRAGAAYLPVDPGLPAERIRVLIERSGAGVAVTTAAVRDQVCWPAVRRLLVEAPAPGRRSSRTGWPARGLDDLAYVLYTSGSTGEPKGAMVAHRGVLNTVLDVNRRFGIGAGDRVFGLSELSFDLSAYDLFGTLAAGGTLVLPDAGRLDPAHWAEVCRAREVTVWNSVPALAQMLVEHLTGDPSQERLALRRVLLSGDKVPVTLPAQIWSAVPGAQVIALGGPTETSIWSIAHVVREPDTRAGSIPYGLPLRNCRHHVLDAHLRPSPDLVPGEIYVGGAGVGMGYLGDPVRTAERFIERDGERLFRSGDIGYFRRDGEIEILGRTDHQVKINGHRIELGEIEAVLGGHPAVRAAAAVVAQGPGDTRRLAAFVQASAPVDPAELTAVLRSRVPHYLVPRVVRVLPELPLSPNGKIDRSALTALAGARPETTGSSDAQLDATGEAVLARWRSVLNRPEAAAGDNFFDLGGDSVQAVRLVAALRADLDVDLGVGSVFRAPTAAGLAALIRNQAGAGTGPVLHARPSAPGPFELSFGQRRLWFLEQLSHDVPAYNLSSSVRLTGALDLPALRGAADHIVRRHDVLRSRFEVRDGRPVRVVDDTVPAVLSVVDLRGQGPAERSARSQELIRAAAATRFDLERGPLFRFALLRLADDEHILVQTLHHLVFDGRSLELLCHELGECYAALTAGTVPVLPTAELRYGDFAEWQRDRLAGGWLDGDRDYWLSQLAGSPPLLQLATRRRPPTQSHRGRTVTTEVDASLATRVRTAALAAGTTDFTVLLSAFAVLLRRYARQDDILIGTPMSDRTDERLRDLMGFFVNTVVLRVGLDGDPTAGDLIERVAATVTAAHEHRDYPLELVIDALGVDRSTSHNPLFQVMFSLEEGALTAPRMPGLRTGVPEVVNETAKFDLTLTVTRGAGGLSLRWEYATDVLDDDVVARMAGEYPALLDGLPTDPARRLSGLIAALADGPDGGAVALPLVPTGATLASRLRDQVSRTPLAAAVCDGTRTYTYTELLERAELLAAALAARGIGPEALVGVCLDRTVDLVATVAGVTCAGAAYLPLDAEHPAERIALILADARPAAVLAVGPVADRLRELDPTLPILDPALLIREGESAPVVSARPENLAYVIYTSGSTGTPKGVAITQHNATRLFDATAELQAGPLDVWTMTHSIAFDFSVWEMWGALLHGGRLVVVPREVLRAPAQLRELVEREQVTVLSQTPTAFTAYAAADAQSATVSPLRLVVLGGEAVELPAVAGWLTRYRDGGPRLVNMYGITETTVHVTSRRLEDADLAGGLRSPIGRPLPDLTAQVLDGDLLPVPVGAVGEMVVGGAGIARGYLGRPGLTADRFRPDPAGAPGARRYHSGDLVRRLDADLDYRGRADRQVKVRGFRIEPAEVEAALLAHPLVAEAVVIGRREPQGDTRLVAYVVTEDAAALPAEPVADFLRTRLPSYLVPAVTTRLDALPRNANGKVDVDALPAPDRTRERLAAEFVAPASPLESAITAVWAGVLGVDRVGALDNFFSLGGDSMRTVEVATRLSGAGVGVTVADVYRNPTPRSLAVALCAGTSPIAAADAPAAQPFALLGETDRGTLLRRFGGRQGRD